MNLFKAAVGGLIGAAVGAYIYTYFNQESTNYIPWVAIVAGLFAGIGVRLLCSTRQVGTGVVAALSTLIVLFGWQYAANQNSANATDKNVGKTIDSSKAVNSEVVTPQQGSDTTDDVGLTEDDATEDDATEDDATEDDATEDDADSSAETGRKSPAAQKQEAIDFGYIDPEQIKARVTTKTRNEGIAFGIAALLAYLMGTGSGKQEQASTESASEENES